MLVAIAGHWIGNMPVEVLNLGEKRCVELLFTNGKSHLLRNVIGKIIHHQSSSNDLEMLQSLLREWQNREGHALAVTSKWHELYVVNVIFWGYSVLIGHLSEIWRREVFCMKLDDDGSIIYQIWSLANYSIWLHADQKISSTSNIWYRQSRITHWSCDETRWNWWAVPASQLSWWVVENHDNWRNSTVARIILQDFRL